ncbi:unnamed protein product [Choristocarpus tenellus]
MRIFCSIHTHYYYYYYYYCTKKKMSCTCKDDRHAIQSMSLCTPVFEHLSISHTHAQPFPDNPMPPRYQYVMPLTFTFVADVLFHQSLSTSHPPTHPQSPAPAWCTTLHAASAVMRARNNHRPGTQREVNTNNCDDDDCREPKHL